jgi:hypothetical protein
MMKIINLMLMGFQLEAVRSGMTNFVKMMASRDKPLRRFSPMLRDIFRHGRLCASFTFLRIILLSPRYLRANLKTIWSSMTNDTIVMTSMNEFRLRMLLDRYFRFNFYMLMTITFFFPLSKQAS